MLNLLGEYYNFKIITRDRDQLESKPYEKVKVNEWNDGSNCSIYYSNLKSSLRKVIKNTEFDIYYLNSFFDHHFSIKIILLLKFNLIPAKPVILAPRGELSKGALSFKRLKKRCYLTLIKMFDIYKKITWHASSKYEAEEIKKEFGDKVKINIAMDVPNFDLRDSKRKHKKEEGKLKILFISSITPIKNLFYVIDILNKVQGDFTLDIYGPVKNVKYWEKCLTHIDEKIRNKIVYRGIAPNDQIHEIYPNYDLFFFPTLGENFGHVIFESLYFGTPILCSYNNLWNKLDYFNAGWNMNLDNKNNYYSLIEKLILLKPEDYEKYHSGCHAYISYLHDDKSMIYDNIKLFKEY